MRMPPPFWRLEPTEAQNREETPLKHSRRLRWAAAPLVAAAITAAVGLISVTTASASEHPRLPARTAAQLLTAVQQSGEIRLSGTVKTSTRLGLPSLPESFAGAGGISLQT